MDASFIKETASYVSSKASALRKYLGESHKDGLFLDSRNLASYDAEDFEDDIEDLVTSDAYDTVKYKQLRLKELQNHVWKGEISPYTYDQGLKNLEPHIPKAALSQVREEFEAKVKSFPVFVDNNFQRDLLNSLEDLQDSSSFVAFEELLAYYRTLQNPFDYANTLAQFGQYVVRNHAQSLSEAQRKALCLIISQNLRQIDTKKYRKIEAERSAIQSSLEELPFYKESLPKGFNSSLPSKVQPSPYIKKPKKATFHLYQHLKGWLMLFIKVLDMQ